MNFEQNDFVLKFNPKSQKTPLVNGDIFGKKLIFTFDTGFSGNLSIPYDAEFYKKYISKDDYVDMNGDNSIGLYGKSEVKKSMQLKNDIMIDGIKFNDELIETGISTLIGNKFLKNYIYLIDWKSNQIKFKSINSSKESQLKSFGFSYLFTDDKALVVQKINNESIPLNLGDQIIKINDIDFTSIKQEEKCKYFLNRVEKDKEMIEITIKREGKLMGFKLSKQAFIK